MQSVLTAVMQSETMSVETVSVFSAKLTFLFGLVNAPYLPMRRIGKYVAVENIICYTTAYVRNKRCDNIFSKSENGQFE